MNQTLKFAGFLLAAVIALLLSQALLRWRHRGAPRHSYRKRRASASAHRWRRASQSRAAHCASCANAWPGTTMPPLFTSPDRFEQDCRAPESVEEAWLLEKLYGPPQRWVLDIVPLQELSAPSLDPGEGFFVEEVGGVLVGRAYVQDRVTPSASSCIVMPFACTSSMPNLSLNPDASPAVVTRRPLGAGLAWFVRRQSTEGPLGSPQEHTLVAALISRLRAYDVRLSFVDEVMR